MKTGGSHIRGNGMACCINLECNSNMLRGSQRAESGRKRGINGSLRNLPHVPRSRLTFDYSYSNNALPDLEIFYKNIISHFDKETVTEKFNFGLK